MGRMTMYDETARFELHEGLREALGEARGDTLMSLLPPVGWADVVTTRDVDTLETRMGSRMDALDARMDGLDAKLDAVLAAIEALRVSTAAQFEAQRATTEAQIEGVRLATEKSIAEQETRAQRDMLRLVFAMVASFVAFAGVLTANNVL